MENKVLALINGKEITEQDLQVGISRLPKDRQPYFASEQGRVQLLNQMIDFELIYEYADGLNLENTEQYIRQLEVMKKDLLTQVGIAEIMKDIQVTHKEVQEFYEANQSMFKVGEMIAASHILIDSEEEAKNIQEKIQDGMSFEQAAQAYSKCPSAAQGGKLGNFTKGKMVPEFENAAFHLDINIVSEPVRTQFGWHLIKVTEKTDEAIRPLEEVQAMIANNLLRDKEKERYKEFVTSLREKNNVEIK